MGRVIPDSSKTTKLPPCEIIAGRYEIQKIIGAGGLSTVYQAYDRQLNRAVALKRMNRTQDQCERELIELAWRESITTAALQHPNIVRVYDFGFDSAGAYIVMELIEGESLESCLERGPLHLDDFNSLARQSLNALSVAHENDLMHRDLKPGNFMLQSNEPEHGFTVKILDFGLAKYVNAPRPQSTDKLNAIMGSIYYMAPEQFSRSPVDHRADLYALGCILYEVLTGQNAFYGDTVAIIIAAHLRDNPIPLHTLREDIPLDTEQWVMKFLQKDPANRHQSASEALLCMPGK